MVVINDYFSQLIRITVDRCGGDVLYFVGDAMVVLFRRGEQEQALMKQLASSLTGGLTDGKDGAQAMVFDEAAVRACMCAAMLMQEAPTYTHGEIQLMIHIGSFFSPSFHSSVV